MVAYTFTTEPVEPRWLRLPRVGLNCRTLSGIPNGVMWDISAVPKRCVEWQFPPGADGRRCANRLSDIYRGQSTAVEHLLNGGTSFHASAPDRSLGSFCQEQAFAVANMNEPRWSTRGAVPWDEVAADGVSGGGRLLKEAEFWRASLIQLVAEQFYECQRTAGRCIKVFPIVILTRAQAFDSARARSVSTLEAGMAYWTAKR